MKPWRPLRYASTVAPVFGTATLSADGKEIVIRLKYAKGCLANGTRVIEKAPVLTDAKEVSGASQTRSSRPPVFRYCAEPL